MAAILDENVKAALTPEGNLDSLGPYLSWTKGDDTATLDGEFTASELRSIADVMDGVKGTDDGRR